MNTHRSKLAPRTRHSKRGRFLCPSPSWQTACLAHVSAQGVHRRRPRRLDPRHACANRDAGRLTLLPASSSTGMLRAQSGSNMLNPTKLNAALACVLASTLSARMCWIG